MGARGLHRGPPHLPTCPSQRPAPPSAAPPDDRSRTARNAALARAVATPEPVQGRRHMDIQTGAAQRGALRARGQGAHRRTPRRLEGEADQPVNAAFAPPKTWPCCGLAPPKTPSPPPHPPLGPDVYLEELADTVPEADCVTQTDEFLVRPPTPPFVPKKSGIDSATQIEPGGCPWHPAPNMPARAGVRPTLRCGPLGVSQGPCGLHRSMPLASGDLFDFDLEVEPILEVLVGKVLEQGLMEVLQEEELAAMRRHQASGVERCGTPHDRAVSCRIRMWRVGRAAQQHPHPHSCSLQTQKAHFESVRAAELVAAQRLEAAERRKMEERERRLRQVRRPRAVGLCAGHGKHRRSMRGVHGACVGCRGCPP
jgi:hypothetical protein